MFEIKDFHLITLATTKRCNLKCDYCYVEQRNEDMSLDMAKRIVDLAAPTATIDFFGGEPTLRLDFVKDVMQYAKDINKPVRFQMFTNALTYNDELVDLINSGLHVRYSFDGIVSTIARTHNEKLTHKIWENIKKIKVLIPDSLINTSITPSNCMNLIENVEFLMANGFNYINHFIVRDEIWKDEDLAVYEENFNKFIDWYIERMDDVYLLYIDELFYRKNRKIICDAGVEGGQIAINAAGEIFPCFRFCLSSSNVIIGDIETGVANTFDNYKRTNFRGCQGCGLINQCEFCMATGLKYKGSFFKPPTNFCEVSQITFKALEKLQPYQDKIAKRLEFYKYIKGRNMDQTEVPCSKL